MKLRRFEMPVISITLFLTGSRVNLLYASVRYAHGMAFYRALILLLAAASGFAQIPARYYVVFLRPNPSRKELPKTEGERIQAAHMANIQKMGRDGILMAAGPFEDTPTTISGIFVFKIDSFKAAKALAAQDPTVLEHRNNVDVHAWQGPEGIGDEYFRLHKADPKTPENMQTHPLVILSPGPAWKENPLVRAQLLADHAHHMDRLREEGKLGAGGPFEVPDDLFSLLIFNAMPLSEAQSALEDDHAIQAGILRAEYHTWWSSDRVLPW
jgi:uncharacterized protein YciI